MKHHSYIPFLLLLLLLTLSCNENSEGVIPPEQMEEILFDYHLTQGIIDIQPPEDFTHNQRYLDAVFTNHGVTEQQFDSSMIYYTREAKQLKQMYVNLNRRFTEIEDALKLQSGGSDPLLGLTASGDTANIWTSGTTIVLRPSSLQNKYIFTLQNDSTLFLRRDKIRLLLNAAFFKEIAEDHNSYVQLGITLEYQSGKTIGMNRTVNSNTNVELDLTADDGDIRALHGFFYYTGPHTTRNIAILTNIAIIRMHDKFVPPPAPVSVDTVKTDTIISDTLNIDTARSRKHLTPEQLLRQSRTKERIEIKAAPDVRTRNSYGPSRRKPRSSAGSK